MRAEQTFINSRLITTGEEIPNNYFQLFPTLHLSYELSDDQELQLSYSRRINRADSDEHNPFAEYDDPRNLTPSTYAQVNTHYRSARLTAQGEYRPLFLLNLGIRQDLLHNKASLILTVSDVFASLNWKRIIDTPELYQKRNYTRNKQIVYLGFSYRFGQRFNKEREQLDFEDKLN